MSERWLGAALLVGVGCYLAQLAPATSETPLSTVLARFGGLGKLALQALASAFAFSNARAFPPNSPIRRSWLGLGLGLGLVALGQALLAPSQLRGEGAPFPSIADLPFTMAYLPLFGALISFLFAFRSAGFPTASLTSEALLSAAVLVAGIALSFPVLSTALHGTGTLLERALSIAYPLLDLGILVPAILIWRAVAPFQGGQAARSWLALVVGISAWVGADTLYAWPSEADWIGPVSNALYLVAYGFLALGALIQARLVREPAPQHFEAAR